MEIYAFGSITRGEIDGFSDIDLLILKESSEQLIDIKKDDFSIYTYERLKELWGEGNPFAWHLYLESKCIFSVKKTPFIQTLSPPAKYKNYTTDLLKFYQLFIDSKESILIKKHSIDFDLSMIFLAIRNFASCFAIAFVNKYVFSRDSALNIGLYSISINKEVYLRLKEARLLATRGIGNIVSTEALDKIVQEFPIINNWFTSLLKKIEVNG